MQVTAEVETKPMAFLSMCGVQVLRNRVLSDDHSIKCWREEDCFTLKVTKARSCIGTESR